MQNLVYAFVFLVDRIRSLVGMVIPIFSEASDFRTWPKWLKVLVHCILLGLIIWGLWWLNQKEPVQKLLRTYATKSIQAIYLPLIFMLIYVLSWLGYFWWKLFNRGESGEFPDIETAWEDAIRKLALAGIRLGDAPLFLVLGKPSGGDDNLFLASGQKIDIRAPNADSPIRIFAGRDAIFVCCSGASTWGVFADVLANPEVVGAMDNSGGVGTATITPGQALQGVDEKMQEEFYRLLQIQSDRPLTALEEDRLRKLGDLIQTAKSGALRRISLSDEIANTGPRRLAFLCKLILRDRRPWCPINGVLALLPWAALETDEIGRSAVSVLSIDLAVIRGTFRQRYPHFLMVCDLEQASGYDEFRRGFPKDMLRQRVGQRLPMIPDRPVDELPDILEQAADWMRMNVLAVWVMKFLRLEWPPEQRQANQFVPSYNRKLFAFLQDFFARGPRLGRLMARGIPVEATATPNDTAAALPLLAGCYFAATGRDEKNQAFVQGVFQRLTETQSAVSWSRDAVDADRASSRFAALVYVVSALLLAISAGIVYTNFIKDLPTKSLTTRG